MALAIEFPQVVWSIEFGGDETVVRQVTMTGGGGAGGGGVTVHNDLTGRSDPDTHPISSITGLSAALAAAGNVDSVNGQTGTVSLDLDDLTDVDTTTDPPDADDVLAWDGVTWTPATLTALGAPGLSNANPADLGTAAPGVATEASRADHVHDLPTAADVGAAASLHVHSGADITSGIVPPAVLGTGGAGGGAKFLADDSTFKAPPSLGAVLGDVKMLSAQASVSFTSIPNTYASLVVVYQVRGDNAGVSNTGIRVTFNNDSGSNYNGQFVGGNNTTAYAAIQTAAAFGYLGEMPAATATSGYSSSGTIEIPNYMGTAFFKNAMFATTRDTNGYGANMVAYRGHIVWKSTTAISRIDLFPQAGNFLTGSRVTLYGIVGA